MFRFIFPRKWKNTFYFLWKHFTILRVENFLLFFRRILVRIIYIPMSDEARFFLG